MLTQWQESAPGAGHADAFQAFCLPGGFSVAGKCIEALFHLVQRHFPTQQAL